MGSKAKIKENMCAYHSYDNVRRKLDRVEVHIERRIRDEEE
jgi:hypothetical protein